MWNSIVYNPRYLSIMIITRSSLLTQKKGRIAMVKTIRLTQEEVQNFVNAASRCDFDIDICYNRYVVDAKSFLGVYGLDFSRPLRVSYDGYSEEFEQLLKKYTVAS